MFHVRWIVFPLAVGTVALGISAQPGGISVTQPIAAGQSTASPMPIAQRPAETGILLALRERPRRCLRVSRESRVVTAVLDACQGRVARAPERKPAWHLQVFSGKAQRSFVYWPGPGILGERGEEDRFRCWHAPALKALLRGLPPALNTSLATAPKEVARTQALPMLSGAFPDLPSLVAHAPNVFLGRIVGVSECYYEGVRPLQWTSYVIQVATCLEWSPRPLGALVRLRWPGGYLNGGEVGQYPLLSVGGDYIFFTRDAVRQRQDGYGNYWTEEHGEHGIVTMAWGWIGLGLLRVRGGRVVPPFPELEAELARRVAAGESVPMLNECGPAPIPVWGLPLPEYLRHLRGAVLSFHSHP